jgi:hypothetical protein
MSRGFSETEMGIMLFKKPTGLSRYLRLLTTTLKTFGAGFYEILRSNCFGDF